MVWWRLLLRKHHSSALSLTVSSVLSSSLHLCHVSLCLGAILGFRTPVLLRLLLDLDTYGGVDPLGVFPLYIYKDGC